jgi:hypothetical protein
METHVVPVGCPVTACAAFAITWAHISVGDIWPSLDIAIATMADTAAQEAEVPDQVTLASGPAMPKGNVIN